MESQGRGVKDWYKGKRKFRLLRSSLLPLRHRLVVSGLCYFDRFGKGGSAAGLHRLTGLCRSTTIPKILDELAGVYGAVETRDGLHHPIEVQDGVLGLNPRQVHESEDPAHWSHRYAYDWLHAPAPDSPLTPSQNAVLWRLAGLSRDGLTVTGQTKAGLATLVGVSRHAVADALKALESLRFLTVLGVVSRDRLVIGLNPPDESMLRCFADRKPTSVATDEARLVEAHVKSLEARSGGGSDERSIAVADSGVNRLARRRAGLPEGRDKGEREIIEGMDARNYPITAITEFMDFYRTVGRRTALEIFNSAEQDHRRNYAKNKGVLVSELGWNEARDAHRLLRYKMKEYLGG
jgi:hypothetical protein